MAMDKKVMMALVGGIAVIGAAVAYHLSSRQSEEVEDDIEDDLAQLGAPEYEPNGMLKFDYFLKIFQICSFYGKTQFKLKKKEFIRQRRAALESNNDKEYEKVVMAMTQEEE